MQTDLWLTETGDHDRCPLCSAPVRPGSDTCFACGFSARSALKSPASSVWIDPAARAYQYAMPPQQQEGAPSKAPAALSPSPSSPSSSSAALRQRRRHPNPTTPLPPPVPVVPPYSRRARRTEDLAERAPLIWQYESPNFEVASSLSSLSLLAPEAPTQPQSPLNPRQTRRLPAIEEMGTTPPPAPASGHHAGAPLTLPARAQESALSSQALMPARQPAVVERQDGASWTAGAASNSAYAQIIAASPAWDWRKRLAFNPLDRLRWWLLRPGRIEYMLWLGGTLLLITMTCVLLFVLAFSFQGTDESSSTPAISGQVGANAGSQAQGHRVLSPLQAAFTTSQPFSPGETVAVHGQGFSPHNRVTFTLDGRYPVLGTDGKVAIAPTDARGAFSSTLWLSVGAPWSAGKHTLTIRDMATGRSLPLPVMLAASANQTSVTPGVSATAPATHSTGSAPGTRPTTIPTTSTPTVQGSPVNKTPVPSTPVATHTPAPTSTASATPTPLPTLTATATHASTTSAVGQQSNSTLSTALNQSGELPIGKGSSPTSLLVWIMAVCYGLSMILLGVAGLLYKRRPRSSVPSR